MFTMTDHWRKYFVSISLCFLLMTAGCASKSVSPYAQAQKDSTQRGAQPAVVKTAEQGATFNQFFPTGSRGYDVIPTQEKKGFAEYKLLKDGKTLAMLSISDTTSVPGAAAKYQTSDFKVGNYPAVDQGTTTTGILVNNRYQVKVLSRDPSFIRDDRIAWLQKFDLIGLAKLKPAPTTAAKLPATSSPKARILPGKQPVLAPQPAG